MSDQPLDLPFTGIATFCKLPICDNIAELDADVAIIGAPFDLATQYRSGARFGPRGIRHASAIYGLQSLAYYDHEFDTVFLEGVTAMDCGDVDMVHMRPHVCLSNIESTVRQIIARGALPVLLGGDHAVTIPAIRAFDSMDPVFVIQLDAHLDYADVRHGVREGHGNVMRRGHEMAHVTGIAQIGIRDPGSSGPSDFVDARENGSLIVGPRELRQDGIAATLSRVPDALRYYVTIDVDVFDPALAPGTGFPAPGGLDYYEVTDLLRGIAEKGDVVGFDFVEVAPIYDPTEVTAQLGARVILDFLGAIFHERQARALQA